MYFKHYFPILLLSVLLLSLISCKEDTVEPIFYGSIEGQVLDSETNLPIANAAITTSPPTSAITTDANGEFKIDNIPTGSYSVTAKKNSYVSSTISISVTEGRVTEAVLMLAKDLGSQVEAPNNPFPVSQAVDQELSITLTWNSVESSESDGVKYDVYLYSNNSPLQERVAENLKDTSYVVEDLKYNTTYFWQVSAKDTGSTSSFSQIWSFKTKQLPSYPYLISNDSDGDYEIYLTDENGEMAQLTFNSSKEIWPQFISSTLSIAYVSDADLENHIYVRGINSDESLKITSLPIASYNNVGIGFDVSSDGNFIIYGHYDKLYRVQTNGQGLTQLATAPAGLHFREVSYSDQGTKIVALLIGAKPYESFIYTMNSDGSNMQVFINDVPGSLGSPSFSVDGNWIIYTQDLSGNEVSNGKQLNSHIMKTKIDGSETIDISDKKAAGTNDLFPKLSPDGSKIIFMNGLNSSNETEIWMMSIDGGDRTLVNSNGKFPFWR